MWPGGLEAEVETHSEIFQRFYEGDSSVGNPTRRRMTKLTLSPGLTYGLSRDWAIQAHLPVAWATRSERGQETTSYMGLEDWDIALSWRMDPLFWGRPYVFKGGYFAIGSYARLRLPTADDRAKDSPGAISFGKEDFSLQVGLKTSLSSTRTYWWTEVAGSYGFEKDGYQEGTTIKGHIAYAYRVIELKDYRDLDIIVLVEGDIKYADKGRINGAQNPNSGYLKTHLGLGVQVNPTNHTEIKLGYNIPLYRKFFGRQYVHEGELAFAVSWLF